MALQKRSERQQHYLNQWNNSPDFRDSGDSRDIKYAEVEIERLQDALALEPNISEQVLQLYKSTKSQNLIQGRNIDDIIAASMYIVSRNNKLGISLDRISEITSSERQDIFSMSREMSDELGLTMDLTSPEEYIDRFVSESNSVRVSRSSDVTLLEDDVKETAGELIEEARGRNMLSGKSPSGIAAAAIYMAAKQHGYKGVNQSDMADIADVAEVTIRNRYHEMRDMN